MKYKILRIDGDYDFHNNSTITELPEGAIALTSEEWENRLLRIETNEEILQKAKALKIAQCKAYLVSTDWQVVRLADPTSSDSLKESVAEKRALARSNQDLITACETLEELNLINTDF